MADSFEHDANRKEAIIAMMMRPIPQNRMGLASPEDAEECITKIANLVCKWLWENGVPPRVVSHETFELLVWKEIFAYCGIDEKSFAWNKEFEASCRPGVQTASDEPTKYDEFCMKIDGGVQEEREVILERLRASSLHMLTSPPVGAAKDLDIAHDSKPGTKTIILNVPKKSEPATLAPSPIHDSGYTPESLSSLENESGDV